MLKQVSICPFGPAIFEELFALGVKVRIDADEQQAGKCRWFQTMLFRDQDNNRNACLDGQNNFLPFIPMRVQRFWEPGKPLHRTESDRQRWESGLKNRCGRACHFWSEQPSRLAPKRPNLKLSAQILSLLFADKLFVICIPKEG